MRLLHLPPLTAFLLAALPAGAFGTSSLDAASALATAPILAVADAPSEKSSSAQITRGTPLPRRRPEHRNPSNGRVFDAPTTAAEREPAESSTDDVLAAHELARLRASLEWAAQQGLMNVQQGTPSQTAESKTATVPAGMGAFQPSLTMDAPPIPEIVEAPVRGGPVSEQTLQTDTVEAATVSDTRSITPQSGPPTLWAHRALAGCRLACHGR